MYKVVLFVALLTCSMQTFACDEPELISIEPYISFHEPLDGAIVSSPFDVRMNAEDLVVEPAGEVKAYSGHHHIIIDGTLIPAGITVPKDDQHKHFGKGQTETKLTLTPGEHTLTLQFADGMHTSYGARLSQTIKITVE